MFFIPGQWHIDHGYGLFFEYVPDYEFLNGNLRLVLSTWVSK
jgi:hypothetical protein